MTDEFRAGVEWLFRMQSVFSGAETRLIWALLKADGRIVSVPDLEFAVTGQRFVGSNVLRTHICRVRARAMGLDIVAVRGVGYRIDVQPSSSFYSAARAIPQQEKAA